MVSYDKIKRDRASIASPAPFEIPARFLSGEFLAPALPDAAVARVVSRCARRFWGSYSSFILFCSGLFYFAFDISGNIN